MSQGTNIQHERGLDDVLIAMDVVDTLRHREQTVLRELDGVGREDQLVKRLKEIYTAQGMDVSEHVIRDGVKALEERRFAYQPPKPSISVRLAKLYVSRDKWLKPLVGSAAALATVLTTYHFAVTRPAEQKAIAAQVELNETLPLELQELRTSVQASSQDEKADTLAETYYQDGLAAISAEDRKGALSAIDALKTLQSDLAASYEVRVVYGPGVARSGVFRIPDADPNARNFYLIVEAVDAAGRKLTVPVISEEDQSRQRANRWGQRVSEDVFYAVAADKTDDQIIQNAIIGRKRQGQLDPEYSVDAPGGAILEW